MLFPSNLFKGKDEKKETPDYEKIISEKNAEIESLRAEIEQFKMNKIESSTEENTSKKLPIDITLLRNILLNTYNRIDRNNKAPRYSILNLLNIINYTQPSIETKVPAMQEINYIKSYIEVRKHASSERPMIRFTYAPTLRRQLVHSGLFLPLVNYAFENTMHGAQIDIKILEIDNAMTIDIVMPQNNNINSAFIILSPEFQDLKKKLDILYPGSHAFEIKSLSANIAIRMSIKYEKVAPIASPFDDADDTQNGTGNEGTE